VKGFSNKDFRMGVTLDYCTLEPLEPAVRNAILQEAASIIPTRDWWCESMMFYDPEFSEYEGCLSGGNKIFLSGYTANDGTYVNVDLDEDNLMACRDASFIVALLSAWSKRFGISWSVSCAGENIGMVDGGGPNEYLREFLTIALTAAGIDPADPSLEDRRKAISAKYASRW